MVARRALLVICLIAFAHGLFFIWYQRPDWNTAWTDQDGYRRLGHALATTGTFTRYPDSAVFVPEVLRTPLYPIFVAIVYRLAGERQVAVTVVQALCFAMLCALVYAIARSVASESIAVGAAAVAALYPPLPYFGALVMTELWTALVFTAGMWAVVRAVRRNTAPSFALAGVLLAAAGLSRPVFWLFPPAIAMVGIIVLPLLRVRPRPAPSRWIVLLCAAAIALSPWFAYNYVNFGQLTMSPAGGIGRGTWEGSWQAVWPGRLQAELTQAAEDAPSRAELDARIGAIAGREHLPSGPMLDYVHQWADIRRIWDAPQDPTARARARVVADREYLRAGLSNLRSQSPGQLAKRVARGVFVLWAAEIPFRYSTINQLPPMLIRICWLFQALLMAAALYGLVVLARTRRLLEACILGAPLLYVTAVHVPLLTEARQSLPAKPIVIVLAVIGVARMIGRDHTLTSPETAGS